MSENLEHLLQGQIMIAQFDDSLKKTEFSAVSDVKTIYENHAVQVVEKFQKDYTGF
jgi:hypothetical protein